MPFPLRGEFKVLSWPALKTRPRTRILFIYSWTVVASRINVYSPGISNEDQNLDIFSFMGLQGCLEAKR